MERYKKKQVSTLILSCIGIAIVSASLGYLLLKGNITPANLSERWTDFWNGYMLGLLMGFDVSFVFCAITAIVKITNKEKLKAGYIKENDERMKMILEKTGSSNFMLDYLVLVIATVVSGYFNAMVSLTLIGVLFYYALSRVGKFVYYNHKY